MKALVFLALALALAGGEAVAACRIESAATPTPPTASPAFCAPNSAACTRLGEAALCGCLNGDGDAIDYLQAKDGTVSARPAQVSGMYGPGDFRAFTGDVDGDGRGDIVMARLRSISNGLGVSAWQVTLAGPGDAFARPATTLDIAEFGPDIFAPRLDGAPGCRLLATRWRSDEEANYFTGVWYDVTGAGLSLAPAGGGLERRLLNSFERQRQQTAARLERSGGLAGTGEPLAWLTAPKARPFDPRLPAPADGAAGLTVAGIEARATAEGGPAGAVLVLRDAAGVETALPLIDILVGEIAARRLWPAGYRPGDDGAWTGRAALIEAESPANDGGPVVWLR
ncbi:hypothetical protein [Zavarzinia aquatilis]|uniref:VCBS repeat-containing protein n=1 Tax=Zavarzinia aquatilis TaxID=2211142 RepID=A0A317EAU4_9PROT|nr:hypothetical protein [Zavarzinia aquatilis]PWR24247.1 hypothetical protein DKG74_09015 [Zavarzinia aquatilis]